MTSQIRSAGRPRTLFARALLLSVATALVLTANTTIGVASDGPVTPNYELASQWTTSRINKAVFDTSITPHWLETSDRFWYTFETRDGKRYFLVDPLKKSKTPLFDNAKLAAKLTAATLVPMDAQHLPIKTVKAIKSDTALRLEVEVPKNADIPGLKKTPPKPTTTTSDKQGGQQGDENELDDDSPSRGAAGAATRATTTTRTATRSRSSSNTTSPARRSRCCRTSRTRRSRAGRRCRPTTAWWCLPAATTCS